MEGISFEQSLANWCDTGIQKKKNDDWKFKILTFISVFNKQKLNSLNDWIFRNNSLQKFIVYNLESSCEMSSPLRGLNWIKEICSNILYCFILQITSKFYMSAFDGLSQIKRVAPTSSYWHFFVIFLHAICFCSGIKLKYVCSNNSWFPSCKI